MTHPSQQTCQACHTEIQRLIDYLDAATFSDMERVPHLVDKARTACQALIVVGVLESDDFESVAVRYRRLQRLIELNGPEQIIQHEFTWLQRMAGILIELAQGQEPVFTTEEQEDLEFHQVLNGFNDDE
jgi:hypothetical protein